SCGCGRYGCLETYASATGLVRTMKEILHQKETDSILRDLPEKGLSSKAVSEAAAKGDQLAMKAIDRTAKILGSALANFIAFSAPEAFVLFGGLARAGDLLFE